MYKKRLLLSTSCTHTYLAHASNEILHSGVRGVSYLLTQVGRMTKAVDEGLDVTLVGCASLARFLQKSRRRAELRAGVG